MTEELLLRVVMVEAAVLMLVLSVLVGHAWWLGARRRREDLTLDHAASTLAAAAEGTTPGADALGGLAALSTRAQITVFGELGQSLSGIQRDRLAHVAAQIGLLARAERWCGGRRWGRRLRGARLLTLLGGGHDVVPALLGDPRPEVRAQAAQWAGEHAHVGAIERLLAMLSDPETVCRFTVKDSLVRVGRPATEPLLRYLSEAGDVPPADALDLAAGLADSRFLAPAVRLCGSKDAETRARAATLAGSIGGPQAARALTGLLADPAPAVRTRAAKALGKLGHWPAARELAGCMRDPSWEVRRTAAVALRAFGAPGLLLLRRTVTDPDSFASDMARQVLDLTDDVAEAVSR